jgi:hypothetical protein
MRKHSGSKLELHRETLLPLNDQTLDNVNGGTTPASPATPPVFMASVRFCQQVSNALLTSAQRSCFTCRR